MPAPALHVLVSTSSLHMMTSGPSGDRDFACKWACDSELTHSQQALPLGLESFTLPSQVVACCLLAEHRPLGGSPRRPTAHWVELSPSVACQKA